MSRLLDFIVKEPGDSASFEETYKFPCVCASFFCLEFGSVLKLFFENAELLKKLFSFLLSENEPLPVLAGYFSKACETLMVLNSEAFLRVFYSENYQFALMHHLNLTSLSDLLLKILSFSTKHQEFQSFVIEISEKLIEKMQENRQSSVATNIQQVLVKYIHNPSIAIPRNFRLFEALYTDSQYSEQPEDFLNNLFSGPHFAQLVFEKLQDVSNTNSRVVKANLNILLAILTKFVTSNEFCDGKSEGILQVFVKNFSKFNEVVECLERGTEEKVLIFELVRTLCLTKCAEFQEKIVSSGILLSIMKVFENSFFSSILHNSFVALVSTILVAEPNVIKSYLLDTGKLADLIVRHGNSPMVQTKNCMIRKGYMGHLNILANILIKLEDFDTYSEEILENTEGWFEFVSNVLVKQNLVESRQLGGEQYEDFFDKFSSDEEPEQLLENPEETLEDSGKLLENPEKLLENPEKQQGNSEILQGISELLEKAEKLLEDPCQTLEVFNPVSYWALPIDCSCPEDL